MLANFPLHVKDFSLRQLLEQWHRLLDGNVRLLNTTVNATTYAKENIDGFPIQVTSPGVANTEFTLVHGLNRIPNGRLVIWQDKAGHLYQGPATGTAWTTTNAYFKCDVATVTFLLLIV